MTYVGKPLCFSVAFISIHAECTKIFFENKGAIKPNIFIIDEKFYFLVIAHGSVETKLVKRGSAVTKLVTLSIY